MQQLVDIEYAQDGENYKITLMARSVDALYELARIPALVEKEGENLAQALLESGKGGFSYMSRYKNGVKNDGPNGQPAGVAFFPDGAVEQMHFYKDGKLEDAAGVPAMQTFHENGRPHIIAYFTNDISAQGPHGEYAWQEMDKKGVVTRLASADHKGQLTDLTADELDEFKDRYLTAKKIGEIQKTFGGKLQLRAP